MITIDKIKLHGFTLLIDGNDGEEQMAVVSTTRQDGTTSIVVVEVSVNGDARVTRIMVTDTSVVSLRLEGLVTDWTNQGRPPEEYDQADRDHHTADMNGLFDLIRSEMEA